MKDFRKHSRKFLTLRLQSKISERVFLVYFFMMTHFFAFHGCVVCKYLHVLATRILTNLEFSSKECICGFSSDFKVDAVCLQNLQKANFISFYFF